SPVGGAISGPGLGSRRAFAVRLLEPEVASLQARRRIWDFKSRLLHHCQARHIGLPEFVVVRSDGPDHRKEFEVEVLLRGTSAGQGVGASKKEAEQKAAHMALLREGIVFDDEEE
ncbi:MAG TPA: putative dsRNA-binding protein, partial [Candidatus Hydrogenedentes bacterium]|nr:putative dsRNA-binding protein [Candidatus Hydrogenedentota bacterium]